MQLFSGPLHTSAIAQTAVFQIPFNSAFINHPAILTLYHVSQKSLYRNDTHIRGETIFYLINRHLRNAKRAMDMVEMNLNDFCKSLLSRFVLAVGAR